MDDVIYGQPQEKSPKTLGKDSSRMHKKFIYCLYNGEYFPIQKNVFASIKFFFFRKEIFLLFCFQVGLLIIKIETGNFESVFTMSVTKTQILTFVKHLVENPTQLQLLSLVSNLTLIRLMNLGNL